MYNIILKANDLQLLHSFLLNSKCSITVAGPQQNLPPTILSPLPFQGGSIQFLRIKTGALRVINFIFKNIIEYSHIQTFSMWFEF